MSKKYTPTKWVANKTVATADAMNNIEQGIADAHDIIDDIVGDFSLEINAIKLINTTGECFVLKTYKNTTIMVDCGSRSEYDTIVSYLDKNEISRLDYLIITHYHSDHIGCFENILQNYCDSNTVVILPGEPNFDKFVSNGSEFRIATQKIYDLCSNNGVIKKIPSEGEIIDIDDIKLRFLNCSEVMFQHYYDTVSEFKPGETDYNNFSLVFELVHRNNRALFTGDICVKAQEILTPFLSKCDLLKCQHHSVDTYVNEDFIKTLNPDMAFCSINASNTAPPKSGITKYLVARDIPYYVTCQSGDIRIISDGNKLHCSNKPYIVDITMQRMLSTYGVENVYYYGFADIGKYNSSSELVDFLKEMKKGSIALVNYPADYKVTPNFISGYGACGFIQKASDNKMVLFIKDNKPGINEFYIGEYYTYLDPDNVVWTKVSYGDSGWKKAILTDNFVPYSTNADTTPIYRKNGNNVEIKGSVKPIPGLTNSSTKIEIFTLPPGFRPSLIGLSTICQGSGNNVWLLSVEVDGKVTFSRYRSGDNVPALNGNEWLPFNISFTV